MSRIFPSPSLRGSGLKFYLSIYIYLSVTRLPLYEGVDWNGIPYSTLQRWKSVSLFTREWIEIAGVINLSVHVGSLPLYEGVDWNLQFHRLPNIGLLVSLFTREWIEISIVFKIFLVVPSPSLRGSGLKCPPHKLDDSSRAVSLFTREWIEILNLKATRRKSDSLPLYEGVDWNSSTSSGLQSLW